MKPKQKRIIYWIRWVKTRKCWIVIEAGCTVPLLSDPKKKYIYQWACGYCREKHREGELCQLRVCGKDGKVQTEHTYGKDPRRYPG